jgi:hypothetical protein
MSKHSASAAVDGHELTAQYEQLREQALSGTGRGLGLTLFLREGMTAWLAAWLAGDLARAMGHTPIAAAPTPRPTHAGRRELAMLLAGLAISCYHEGGSG